MQRNAFYIPPPMNRFYSPAQCVSRLLNIDESYRECLRLKTSFSRAVSQNRKKQPVPTAIKPLPSRISEPLAKPLKHRPAVAADAVNMQRIKQAPQCIILDKRNQHDQPENKQSLLRRNDDAEQRINQILNQNGEKKADDNIYHAFDQAHVLVLTLDYDPA